MANNQMKRCSKSLIIRKIYIKTMRYIFIALRIAITKKQKQKKSK